MYHIICCINKSQYIFAIIIPAGLGLQEDRTLNKQTINLQDVFLNQVRREKLAVTVYMTNGFQLKGVVKGFDNFTVVLDSDGKQQLIYKHAISTVSPLKPVNMIFSDNFGQNKDQG